MSLSFDDLASHARLHGYQLSLALIREEHLPGEGQRFTVELEQLSPVDLSLDEQLDIAERYIEDVLCDFDPLGEA